MNLNDLKKEIPYSWKVQTGKRGAAGGWCVAYIDARDVMQILDEVVGPGCWKDEYSPMAPDCSTVIGRVSIKVDNEWVTKEDIGTHSDTEAEKGAFSDAFKRAAVKWGIGRFLYDLEMVWVDFDGEGKPMGKNKVRIKDLTKYINSLKGNTPNSDELKYEPFIPGMDSDDAFNEMGGSLAPSSAATPSQKCPKCGKTHSGRYPKCLDCYRAEKN